MTPIFVIELHSKVKGHQGSNLGGHSFVFLNVSINKKPFFFSEVVNFNNIKQSVSTLPKNLFSLFFSGEIQKFSPG